MVDTLLDDELHAGASAFERFDPESPVLNGLLHRVVIRQNRLRRLIALDAPEIILRNERRMLRTAVNAVIENSGTPKSGDP